MGKIFLKSLIDHNYGVCKMESQFLVPRNGFRGRPISWCCLHLPRPTHVATATKFYDKIL